MPWENESGVMRQVIWKESCLWELILELRHKWEGANPYKDLGEEHSRQEHFRQDPELGTFRMFKNQKKPEWLEYNDWDTELHEITESTMGKHNSSTFI